MRFQIGTSKQNDEFRWGRRYLPYVFTEQGITILAGVLKNDIAVKVSISIIKSFIEMRKFISSLILSIHYMLIENFKERKCY